MNIKPSVASVTFTVQDQKDLWVNGKRAFSDNDLLNGNTVMVLKDAKARVQLHQRQGPGQTGFDITVESLGRRDLSKVKVVSDQGYVSRLKTVHGKEVTAPGNTNCNGNAQAPKGGRIKGMDGGVNLDRAFAKHYIKKFDAVVNHYDPQNPKTKAEIKHFLQNKLDADPNSLSPRFMKAASGLLDSLDKLQRGFDAQWKNGLQHVGSLDLEKSMAEIIRGAAENNGTAMLEKLAAALSFEGNTSGTTEEQRAAYRTMVFYFVAMGDSVRADTGHKGISDRVLLHLPSDKAVINDMTRGISPVTIESVIQRMNQPGSLPVLNEADKREAIQNFVDVIATDSLQHSFFTHLCVECDHQVGIALKNDQPGNGSPDWTKLPAPGQEFLGPIHDAAQALGKACSSLSTLQPSAPVSSGTPATFSESHELATHVENLYKKLPPGAGPLTSPPEQILREMEILLAQFSTRLNLNFADVAKAVKLAESSDPNDQVRALPKFLNVTAELNQKIQLYEAQFEFAAEFLTHVVTGPLPSGVSQEMMDALADYAKAMKGMADAIKDPNGILQLVRSFASSAQTNSAAALGVLVKKFGDPNQAQNLNLNGNVNVNQPSPDVIDEDSGQNIPQPQGGDSNIDDVLQRLMNMQNMAEFNAILDDVEPNEGGGLANAQIKPDPTMDILRQLMEVENFADFNDVMDRADELQSLDPRETLSSAMQGMREDRVNVTDLRRDAVLRNADYGLLRANELIALSKFNDRFNAVLSSIADTQDPVQFQQGLTKAHQLLQIFAEELAANTMPLWEGMQELREQNEIINKERIEELRELEHRYQVQLHQNLSEERTDALVQLNKLHQALNMVHNLRSELLS